jgi:hypothetical protein
MSTHADPYIAGASAGHPVVSPVTGETLPSCAT